MKRHLLIYVAISLIMGIVVASPFMERRYVLIPFFFLLVYFVAERGNRFGWLWLMISFMFGMIYIHIYDGYHTSGITKSDTLAQGNIISTPVFDGDKLTVRLKLVSGERVQVLYRIKSEQELVTLRNQLKIGQTCKWPGQYELPGSARNFAAFDYQQYLYYAGIHYTFIPEQIKRCDVTSTHLVTLLPKVRADAIKYVDSHFPSPASAYVKALVFGDKGGIDAEVIRLYQQLGISHLLAISGLHVGLLLLLCYYMGMRLGLTREMIQLLLFILLPMYMMIAGGAPSVIRACLMGMMGLLALKVKQIGTADLLALVAIGYLLVDPYAIFQVGFQLSFVVSFALITSSQLILQKATSRFKQILYVTIIAQLSSFPLIVFYFYDISLLSSIVNLLFVPFFSFLILPLSLISLVISWLFSNVMVVKNVLNVLLTLSENILQLIEPFSLTVTLGKPPLWMLLIDYVLILFVLFIWERISFSVKKIGLMLSICLFMFFVHVAIPYVNPKGTVTFLDVGQGDAAIIELPYRKAVYVIDVGGKAMFPKENWQKRKKEFDVGADIVVPYLKAHGIRKINKLILTHGDMDHVGGAIAVLKAEKVQELLTGPITSEEMKAIQSIARSQGVTRTQVKSGDSWLTGNFQFDILNPSGGETTENDRSIVIYSVLGGLRFLFTGDLEQEGEQQLIGRYPILGVDVLKVGHHGSKTSTSEQFLQQLKPKLAIVSVGQHNRYGHPNKAVMDRIQMSDVKVLRTDEQGAIRFVFKRDRGTFSWKLP